MKRLLPFCIFGCLLSLQSCVDDDYDLSDIDTSTEINIVDFQIPIKLDEVKLDAIFDLDEEDQIKVVNDEYVLWEDGTFKADPINIPTFKAAAPEIKPIEAVLQNSANAASAPTRAASDITLPAYKFPNTKTTISIHADKVDKAIVGVDAVGVAEGTTLSLDIVLDKEGNLKDYVNEVSIKDLEIVVLPGLDATIDVTTGTLPEGVTPTYDAKTGKINIPNLKTKDHNLGLCLNIKSITKDVGFALKNQVFDLQKDCYISDGLVIINQEDLDTSLFNADGSLNVAKITELTTKANSISFACIPVLSDVEPSYFSGTVQYSFDGLNVKPISLTNIPDIISQNGTSLTLENPQVYLNVNNPLYKDYQLKAELGVKVTTVYESGKTADYQLDLDDNGSRKLMMDKADNIYCLSPKKPVNPYLDYISWHGFEELKNILTGEKLPDNIEIDLENANIPTQTVTNFRLNRDIDAIEGKYTFYAPLTLLAGSHVSYIDTIDGWNTDDLEDFIISKVSIKTKITSDIPVAAEIEMYPINKYGEKIKGSNGQTMQCNATIKPGENPVNIELSGKIQSLDGIIIVATLDEANGTTLKPSQTLKFTETCITVSGSYVTEL